MKESPQGLDSLAERALPRAQGQCTVLANSRLRIRELAPQDAPALQLMHADPRVTAWLIDDCGVSLDDATNAALFIRAAQRLYRKYEGYGVWAVDSLTSAGASAADSLVADHHSGFCGFVALMPVVELPGDVEIGIRLTPSMWGSGLSFEVTRLLLGYGFDQLCLPEVYAFCDPRNRSARLNNEAQGADWIHDAVHQGTMASHYVLSRSVFEKTRQESRQQRMRAVLRRAARDRPSPASDLADSCAKKAMPLCGG
jgi:RimJ/RimL family protein N-acetyltransferase